MFPLNEQNAWSTEIKRASVRTMEKLGAKLFLFIKFDLQKFQCMVKNCLQNESQKVVDPIRQFLFTAHSIHLDSKQKIELT